MFPNSYIPQHMNDIMHQLTEDEIEGLRDVSLAEALMEARRILKIKYDKLREETNAKIDKQLEAIRAASTSTTDTKSTSTEGNAPNREARCESPTSKLESVLVEERNVRRRLNNGTTSTNTNQNEASSSHNDQLTTQHRSAPTNNLQRDQDRRADEPCLN
jgi:hypothetical protein